MPALFQTATKLPLRSLSHSHSSLHSTSHTGFISSGSGFGEQKGVEVMPPPSVRAQQPSTAPPAAGKQESFFIFIVFFFWLHEAEQL